MFSETQARFDDLAPDGETARQLRALRADLSALASAGDDADFARLRADLERVEKQFARAGKELFKANARAQTQPPDDWQQRARDAESENARLREQLLAAHQQARQTSGGELAQALFPALDGLDEALNSGARVLESAPATPPAQAATSRGWWQRLREKFGFGEPTIPVAAARSWLEGASLVRERLLETLADADVRPIAARGERFDPHRHRAVETVPPTDEHAPGFVVSERRRGYCLGDRVLRFAEVVVALETGDEGDKSQN